MIPFLIGNCRSGVKLGSVILFVWAVRGKGFLETSKKISDGRIRIYQHLQLILRGSEERGKLRSHECKKSWIGLYLKTMLLFRG